MSKKQSKSEILVRLVREMRPLAKWLLLGAVLSVATVLCTVAVPDILGELIQQLYDYWAGGRIGSVRQTLVSGLVLLMLLYFGNGVFSYADMYIMNWAVSSFYSCDLRIRISEKLKRLPVRYVDQTPVGDILSRMTEDVSTLGGYVHDVFDTMIKGFFQILLIGIAIFREDWRLAGFVVVLIPLSVLLSTKISSYCEESYHRLFTKEGELTGIVEESFSNYPTTKAYNLEEYTAQKHQLINEDLRKAKVKADFVGSVVQPIIKLTNALAYIFINLVGGWLIVTDKASVGIVVTIVLYARQLASPLEQIAGSFGQMNHVVAAARRVYDILDKEEEAASGQTLSGVPQGNVEFDHVQFSYDPKEPLIKDLNVSVRPGQNVAIVGPTGAGKTTIVNLLMRFYDPISGSIRLDGNNIGDLSRKEVRGAFGMVLQDTWLFRGTIAENIAYGKPGATREEIEEAARKAYCDHFIRTMPDGYDTIIGEDTTNLSGGQKQLLTIARALLANKPLLILDEATSNVDTRTEILIQKAMDELMEGKTCFVIAHRLSTIVDSDLILVLDHGDIVEQGTHRELLKKGGFYHKLYTSQYAI